MAKSHANRDALMGYLDRFTTQEAGESNGAGEEIGPLFPNSAWAGCAFCVAICLGIPCPYDLHLQLLRPLPIIEVNSAQAGTNTSKLRLRTAQPCFPVPHKHTI